MTLKSQMEATKIEDPAENLFEDEHSKCRRMEYNVTMTYPRGIADPQTREELAAYFAEAYQEGLLGEVTCLSSEYDIKDNRVTFRSVFEELVPNQLSELSPGAIFDLWDTVIGEEYFAGSRLIQTSSTDLTDYNK